MDCTSLITGRHIHIYFFPKVVAVIWLMLGAFSGGLALAQDIGGFRLYPAHPYDNVGAVAFTPDSKQLIAYNALGKLSIVEVQSGRELKSFKGPEFISSIAMSPMGDVLVGMRDNFEDIFFWRTSDWKQLPILHTPDEQKRPIMDYRYRVRSIAISPDGKTLAAGCAGSTIFLWDMASRKIIQKTFGSTDILTFSPDGSLLASASPHEGRGSTVTLFDAKTGYKIRVIVTHPNETTAFAFLPGGNKLVSAGDDRPYLGLSDLSIKIWDINSGKQLQTLKGHTNSVRAILPLPGDKLITGGMDQTVRFWDLKTSQELRKVDVGGIVTTLVLSPDGQYLACGMITSEGRYHLWKLSEVFPEAVASGR